MQVKKFESDFPEETVIASSREYYFSLHKVNEDGSFLVETGYTKFEEMDWQRHWDVRYIYDFVVYSPEGELLDVQTYRGYRTFKRGYETYGVGWVGNSMEEADRYGFVDAYGNLYYDKEISEILRKTSGRIVADIIFYGNDTGIHAYDMNNGKKADIIVDSGYVLVVAGNYVYYEYSTEVLLSRIVYRVKTERNGLGIRRKN